MDGSSGIKGVRHCEDDSVVLGCLLGCSCWGGWFILISLHFCQSGGQHRDDPPDLCFICTCLVPAALDASVSFVHVCVIGTGFWLDRSDFNSDSGDRRVHSSTSSVKPSIGISTYGRFGTLKTRRMFVFFLTNKCIFPCGCQLAKLLEKCGLHRQKPCLHIVLCLVSVRSGHGGGLYLPFFCVLNS